MQKASRGEIVSWAMYDFANSSFYTTIVSAVFSVYFATVLVPEGGARLFGRTFTGEVLWGYSNSLAFALVVVSAPVIGAICDAAAIKKRLTAVFWIAGVAATMALALPEPGQFLPAALTLIVALFCWQTTVQLTNAFLPELATPEQANRISGFAWAVGYVGGGLCLGLNLWMIAHGKAIGETTTWIRYSILVAGAWWFVFAFPFFLGVRERRSAAALPSGVVAAGFRQALKTGAGIRRNRELFKFLIAFMLINAGLVTVLTQAAIFGSKNIGLGEVELVGVILMVQIVAAPGALGFGHAADRLGTKRSLFILLAIWIAMCIWAYVMKSKWEFWGLAAIVAVVMGGTQSVCRAAIAQLSPPAQVAEYYGFFAVAGRFSEVVGTFIYPTVIATVGNPRAGILSIAVMFAVGAAALSTVREPSSLRPSD